MLNILSCLVVAWNWPIFIDLTILHQVMGVRSEFKLHTQVIKKRKVGQDKTDGTPVFFFLGEEKYWRENRLWSYLKFEWYLKTFAPISHLNKIELKDKNGYKKKKKTFQKIFFFFLKKKSFNYIF